MQDLLQQIGDFLNIGWDIGNWTLTVRMIIYCIVLIVFAFLFTRYITGWLLNDLKEKDLLEEGERKKIRSILRTIVGLAVSIGLLKILNLDYTLYTWERDLGDIEFHLSLVCIAFMVFKFAQLLDWIVARILIDRYFATRSERELNRKAEVVSKPKDDKSVVNKTVQYVVYLVASILILKSFSLDIDFHRLEGGGHLTFSNILQALLTLLIARLIVWFATNLVFYNYYQKNGIEQGTQYAINQIFKYIVYVIAILLALSNSLYFDLDIILGGAAALMVGIGLGLQSVFSDLVSGLILLFERTVDVGDVVEVGGIVGTITKIGIRTSVVQVRDNTSIIVPNTKFTTDNVINWSHNDDKVRFKVNIGVAYGSDTVLVKEKLLKVAEENPDVLQRPAPLVRFVDFADSSLNFELHIWSRNFIRIEDVKSDIRFQIDSEFRKNNIEIPFPQRVIWRGESSSGEGGMD